MTFRNSPELKNEQGEWVKKQYTHQPLTIEHYGIHAKIQENGKIVLTSGVTINSEGTEEFDEITIPASLVFKLASALKMTRSEKMVTVAEVKDFEK
jgi:hypothetical protein